MSCEVHKDDNGTRFIFTIKDCKRVIQDISAATVMKVVFRKPDRVVIEKDLSYLTDGKDGKVLYIMPAIELDQEGKWKVQVKLTNITYDLNSTIHEFTVFNNLI